jgi:hypothetical protein
MFLSSQCRKERDGELGDPYGHSTILAAENAITGSRYCASSGSGARICPANSAFVPPSAIVERGGLGICEPGSGSAPRFSTFRLSVPNALRLRRLIDRLVSLCTDSARELDAIMCMKKALGLYLLSMTVLFGLTAPAIAAGSGNPKLVKSRASGSFVSANFDFDHADLSTPAFYVQGEGIGNGGRFTYQAVVEVAPDRKSCTIPGRTSGDGAEFALVGRTEVLRYTATGDLLFLSSRPNEDSIKLCADFSTFPAPPFPYVVTEETGVVTGGTGGFASATGTFGATEKGEFLSTDPAGKTGFGWFTSHIVIGLRSHSWQP